MSPLVKTFFDPHTFTATHVVRDPETTHAVIIDPVLDYDQKAGRTSTISADQIIAYIREQGLTVDWILETHIHADHLTAGPYLKENLGGRTGIGEHVTAVQKTFETIFAAGPEFAADGSQFDQLFSDGEEFRIGGLTALAMHTPGHTPACIVYVIGDAVFMGDTLFMPDYGTARCDFPGGDARTLYRSIRKIFSLPAKTRMFLCHDYKAQGRDEFVWQTTVAAQKAHNIHIHDGVTEEEFVAMREARDKELSMPALILPSVQINMRAGHFPPPENGVSYLKIPLNVF